MAIMTGGREHGRDAGIHSHGRGEIFPGLGAFIGAGVLLGASSSVIVSGLLGRFPLDTWVLGGLGAGLGAILGLFVGLGRGVWRPGRPIPVREPEATSPAEVSPPPQLWDAWLDDGRDLDPTEPEAVAEEATVCAEAREVTILARAAVRPRVISPQTGETITLEDEIGPMIQDGRTGLVVILGGPGSGKTTALRHLDAILPPWTRGRVRLLEELDLTAIASAGPDRLVILASDQHRVSGPDQQLALVKAAISSPESRLSFYRLAPWEQDDAIEYLLATHRDACASVMARLGGSNDFHFPEGIPELWAVILDRMACDESIGDVRSALRRELAAWIGDHSSLRKHIEDFCLEGIGRNSNPVLNLPVDKLAGREVAAVPLARLVRHRPAALLLAADRIAAIIESGRTNRVLADRYPRELVLEVARQIAGNTAAVQHLNDWIRRGNRRAVHPLAAGLLHAATPGWRPDPDCRPRLQGAYLDGVAWPGLNLAGGDLRGAELRHADLSGANLEKVFANRTCFHGANLQEAILRRWIATAADLGGANLSGVKGRHAQFHGANLAGACLVDADLWKADLRGARIEDADFSGANLEDACLRELALSRARIHGARFGGADLHRCDLEGMELLDADFHDADLRGALFTGSRMPNAQFLGADLRAARLAEVDWPGACLRDADLRGANFHLGSSRSGLVDSPIACEGSRTGFYTDDYLDRDVKPAEEIRKANLRGADLRGADIRHVDFYLVDLRDAQYTADQAEHFRRCRAILEDRTA